MIFLFFGIKIVYFVIKECLGKVVIIVVMMMIDSRWFL